MLVSTCWVQSHQHPTFWTVPVSPVLCKHTRCCSELPGQLSSPAGIITNKSCCWHGCAYCQLLSLSSVHIHIIHPCSGNSRCPGSFTHDGQGATVCLRSWEQAPQGEAALAGGVQTLVWLNEWTRLTNVTSASTTCHILHTVQNQKRDCSTGGAIYSKQACNFR